MLDSGRKLVSRWIYAGCGTLLVCSVFSGGVRTARAYPVALAEPEGFHEVSGIDNAWELAPLVLEDLQGVERNLYDWHGSVIVLNFWASWCTPCQIEIPELVKYQSRYGNHGLQIVSVGMDEPRKLSNVARTLGINYPVLVADPKLDSVIMREWGNRKGVLPFSVVIDRDGHLVFMREGMFDSEAFEIWVRPLLDRAPVNLESV